MKRIKKYLGGSYFRLPSLSSEFQTGASLKVPYINTLLQQYITNTGNFSAPIPTSSKVKDNTLKDTVSNVGSSIIGKASDAISDKIFGDSELGRNLGTIFSSGLNSVGDTILNNAIKKAALTDGLTKNLGSSVGGAVAGLGANYLGRGITSILGNNAASRFLGLSASTVGGTIGGKILSSGTKNLFSGLGSINPIGLGMSAVGAGLSAAIGPSKEYGGKHGGITQGMDMGYDAIMAGINFVPGWGLIASGAMALNKGLSNIFGSTDGMTTQDAILGSAFMPAPIKWLNMLGSSKTGTFNNQSWLNTLKTSNFMQNAFGDLEDKFSKAREEAGKTYGTFSQGAKKRALNNIDFANYAWNKILNMADLNEYQNIRSSDMASINNLRYALWILGGFSPLARGKLGMKILNNSINHNLGLRLLSGAALIDNKAMILSAQGGTKIDGYTSAIKRTASYNPDETVFTFPENINVIKTDAKQSKDWINWWLMNREDVLALNMNSTKEEAKKERWRQVARIKPNLVQIKNTKDVNGKDTGAYTNPITKQITFKPFVPVYKGLITHEQTHSIGDNKYQNAQTKKIKELLPKFTYTHPNDKKPNNYWNNPIEIYGRLMQFRRDNKINPKHKFTLDEIKNWYFENNGNLYGNGKMNDSSNMLRLYSPETIQMLLNEIAQNSSLSSNFNDLFSTLIDNKQMILSALNGTKIKKKGIKSGINVDYYDPDNVMSVIANNPNKTIVLDELTVRPYNKLPMQSELFQGVTNQAANEKADEYVNRVTPTAEDLFNIGTLGGLNNLSPALWGRRAYDTLRLLNGEMPSEDYARGWFYGNNGIVSDLYAKEHPYASAAINLAGDIGAFGTFSALRKLPKYAALMKAENMAAQEATALNWRDMFVNSARRTRLGDVEVDNPRLYYHQSDAGKAKNFVSTGRMRTPLEEYWLAKEEAGEHIPTKLRAGIEPGYPQDPGSAMFSQGKLWYGLTPNKPDLLVTAKEMPIANKNASIMSDKASLKALYEQGTRRVTNDNIYTQGPHTPQNTTAYIREPKYGYRRVSIEDIPTIEWADATKTPIITTENAANMTPKQWTAAQDAAIARGDMAEAQRLRDLHFRTYQNGDMIDVNGNPIHVYHGSPEENIIEFYKPNDPRLPAPKGINFKATGEEGIYTSPRKRYAAKYTEDLGGRYRVPLTKEQKALLKAGKTREEIGLPSVPKGRIYDLYSNTKLVPENLNIDFNPFTLSTKEAKLIKSKGYTGFNIPGKKYPEHVVLEPNQLKLADAVTYDDKGVRIPLGERDNFKLNDIRYGLIPIIGGGIGYGLYKNSNKNKNIR